MSRPIVCGVDGSEQSLAAAAVAARLCRRLGAALVLAHAVEGSRSATCPYGDQAQLSRHRRRIHAEMTQLFDRMQRRFGDVHVEIRVLEGAAGFELATLAVEEDAALVVVGSHGRAPVKAALLGSVSSAVVRASDRPVVIVSPEAVPEHDAKAGERSAVVCGVDSSDEARSAARVAATLAAALRLELVLVHAYRSGPLAAAIPAPAVAAPSDHERVEQKKRGSASRLLEQVALDVDYGPPVSMRIEVDAPASALDRCGEAENAELIVVGTHGHGPLASVLLGSTSSRLAASASRPVVVVPKGASLRTEQITAADHGRP